MTRPTEWLYRAVVIVIATAGFSWSTGLWVVAWFGAVIAFGIALALPNIDARRQR